MLLQTYSEMFYSVPLYIQFYIQYSIQLLLKMKQPTDWNAFQILGNVEMRLVEIRERGGVVAA